MMIVGGSNCPNSPASGITLSPVPSKSTRSSGVNRSPKKLSSSNNVIQKELTFSQESSSIPKGTQKDPTFTQESNSIPKGVWKIPPFTQEASSVGKNVSFSDETTGSAAISTLRSLQNIFDSAPASSSSITDLTKSNDQKRRR